MHMSIYIHKYFIYVYALIDLLQYIHTYFNASTPYHSIVAHRNFPPHLQSVEYGECAGEQVQLGKCHGQVERHPAHTYMFI